MAMDTRLATRLLRAPLAGLGGGAAMLRTRTMTMSRMSAPTSTASNAPFPRLAAFSTSACRPYKPMPPRPPPPPEDEIEEMFVKGTGPGGQKINKTNSAVQLIHRPTGIVVKSQATRSRSQNRNHARQLLAARLDELHNGDQSRTAIVADAKRRKKASATKKSRRKYRKLEEKEVQDQEVQDQEGKDQEVNDQEVNDQDAQDQDMPKSQDTR